MLPEKLKQIKSLVNSTAILSPQERSEWLVLLDVMDDRQIAELEKILNGSIIPKPAIIEARPGIVNFPKFVAKASNPLPQPGPSPVLSQTPVKPRAPTPVQPPAAVSQPQAKQMPKLSHIINFPSLEHTSFNNNLPKTALPSVAKAPTVLASGEFFSQIKNILAEKELPAGKKPIELELPSAALPAQSPTAPKRDVSGLPPVPRPKAPVQKPVAQIPAAPIQPKPAFVPPAFVKPPVMPAVQTGLAKSSVTPSPVSRPTPAPAKIFDKVATQPAPIKAVEKPVAAPAPVFKNLPQTPVANKVAAGSNLDNLESLSSLTPKILKETDFSVLIAKLKQLTNQYGYHEVIFNIERSQLYSSYIRTGFELLNKQIDFEVLSSRAGGEDFLSRAEFEKFTDLLAQIQIG